jgi:hypothetical protein
MHVSSIYCRPAIAYIRYILCLSMLSSYVLSSGDASVCDHRSDKVALLGCIVLHLTYASNELCKRAKCTSLTCRKTLHTYTALSSVAQLEQLYHQH